VNSFVVSIECPLCGAPLDFSEGSNAVQCLHCRANLLVTGHKQALSYYIEPKIDKHLAVVAALTALKNMGMDPVRVVEPVLYFVPYYRLTGHDFGWERPPCKPVEEDTDDDEGPSSGFKFSATASFSILKGIAGNLFTGLGKEKDIDRLLFTVVNGSSSGPLSSSEVQLRDRYIEKNFTACNLGGAGLYSIGVRAEVLKLKLFNSETLASLGKIVCSEVSPEEALAKGMKSEITGELLYRAVIGKILSIIYFPFWGVETEHRDKNLISVVDAVSRTVIKPDADPSLKALLESKAESGQNVAGFRPLLCPNCGWDLPVRPDDAVFICSSCNKGWQIYGNLLNEIDYRIGGLKNGGIQANARYLPFWVVETEKNGNPFKFFLPAFRYRRLKFLADLAVNISRKQPEYTISDNKKNEILSGRFEGCYYDQEDAALLACFVNAGLELKKSNAKFASETLQIKSAVLTWFPFAINGSSLVDPFTGMSLTSALFCN